jgi:hypothetical protein
MNGIVGDARLGAVLSFVSIGFVVSARNAIASWSIVDRTVMSVVGISCR